MDPTLWRLMAQGNSQDEVPAILRLAEPGIVPQGVRLIARFGEIATVRLVRGRIQEVRASEEVTSAKGGNFSFLQPDEEPITSLEAFEEFLPSDERRPLSLDVTGRGVVVGIVDWGIDFAHPEFRHPDGRTRILALWDQRPAQNPSSPEPYRYGVVHSAEAINRSLAAEDPYSVLGYNPADADIDGSGTHGTHVASIAVGNGRSGGPVGIAPEADLVFVHLSTWDPLGVDRIGDSVTLLEAVDFILRTAGDRPCVINLSMGRHGGPHDGSTPVEQALDALLRAAPGRAICQSCGNYFNRQIHTSGQLRPAEKRDLVWNVGTAKVTPNELEIWYSNRDTLLIEIRSPDGEIIRRAAQNEHVFLGDSRREIGYVHHRTFEPNTFDNQIQIALYPSGPIGAWQVTLIGVDVIDGRFHAWIERDAACPTCQSRFQKEDAVSLTTTGTICNGMRTIAVGAYDAHSDQWSLAPFSSKGPTRDGRVKPDLVAPGVRVLAARSTPRSQKPGELLLIRKSGTSMACPHVTGCVALMFEAAKRLLHIDETHNLLLANVEYVTGQEEDIDRLGSGYLDIERAVEAARKAGSLAPKFLEVAMNNEENVFPSENSNQEISKEGLPASVDALVDIALEVEIGDGQPKTISADSEASIGVHSGEGENSPKIIPTDASTAITSEESEDLPETIPTNAPAQITVECSRSEAIPISTAPEPTTTSTTQSTLEQNITEELEIRTALNGSGPGFYSYVEANRRFGLPETIQAIMTIGASWEQAHPYGPRIGIGDLSLQGGMPMPPHKSHRNGLDVDIRPARKDGIEGPTDYHSLNYDRGLTQELVNIVRSNGVFGVQYIFFNDPEIRSARSWPGHDNHLHVRFFPSNEPPRELELEAHRSGLQSLGISQEAQEKLDNTSRAIELNRYYAKSLGWQEHFDRIVMLLGFSTSTPNESDFAQAVERWQIDQGLQADGVIGPNTWERMRMALGLIQQKAGSAAGLAGTVSAVDVPQGPFGTITIDAPGWPSFRYKFTTEDVLWTARLIVGEAGGKNDIDNQAVLWAMLNRYAFFTHQYYPTFHQFVRAYSTTLQPVLNSPGAAKRHMDSPDFVRTGGYYPNTNIPKGNLERHIKLQQTPWNKLPPSARSLAERGLRGEIPNPGIGNASEFASTRIYFHDKYSYWPSEDEWRQFTEKFASSKGWIWIGPVQGLDQFKINTFFIRSSVGQAPILKWYSSSESEMMSEAAGEGSPFLSQALDSCWERCQQFQRSVKAKNNPNMISAARIRSETGISVDANPYNGLTRGKLEAVIRAGYNSTQMPETLLAIWAKEGSHRMTTTPQQIPQATTVQNAKTIFRCQVYYMDLGADYFIVTMRQPGGDNVWDDSDSAAGKHESHFISKVQELVANKDLFEDISTAINDELTVSTSRPFSVTPTVRFYALSLLLVDALFSRMQRNSFPQISYLSPALNYIQWNIGTNKFKDFLVSADKHRNDLVYFHGTPVLGGLPRSLESWALHEVPKKGEWKEPRVNAIRFMHYLDSYRPIFESVINLIKPGIEDLRLRENIGQVGPAVDLVRDSEQSNALKPTLGSDTAGEISEVEKTIQAKLNQPFNVSLDWYGGMYRWIVDFDPGFLRLDNKSHSVTDPGSLGGSGKEHFTFNPIRTGKTEIRAFYLSPWKKGEVEARSDISINIDL